MLQKITQMGLLMLSLNTSLVHAYEMEDVSRIDFEVRDPKSRELFFNGYELITGSGNNTRKETWYYNLDKKQVQYEDVVYDKRSLQVEKYRFDNSVTGEQTDFDTLGKEMSIRYRPGIDKPFKEGKLKWEDNAYHGKVFNNLILRNWASLLNKTPLAFALVLPYRFESLGFKIIYDGSRKVDNEDREVFLLQPSSLIIRAIAPHMEFHYSKGDRPRILKFLGPSTIPIKGEKDRMVDILFSYPKA